MVKQYELTRFDASTMFFTYAGTTVKVDFKGGDAIRRARFTTANLFVQDAIENDRRFGSLILLRKTYSDTPDAAKKAVVQERKKKVIKTIKAMNQALDWLAQNGYRPTGAGVQEVKDLMKQANVEFPNLKWPIEDNEEED